MGATLTSAGPRYRSRRLTIQRAASVAKMIGGNRKFTCVTIEECKQARGPRRWVVSFAPANPARQEKLLAEQVASRVERGQGYHFDWNEGLGCYVTDGSRGEVYFVAVDRCSCADWQFRGRFTGTPCKHACSLLSQLERGEVGAEEARELAVAERADVVKVERPRMTDAEFRRVFGAEDGGRR